jgi:hypothetical protein
VPRHHLIRITRRLPLPVLIASAAAVAALAAAVSVWAGAGSSSSAPHVSAFDRATPVAGLSLADRRTLERIGATPKVGLVASYRGVRYFIGRTRAGDPCYFTSGARSVRRLGMIACPSGRYASTFPSRAEPLYDMSIMQWTPDRKHARVLQLSGFAADSVRRVAIQLENGRRLSTVVSRNVYTWTLPTKRFARFILGLDANGHVVFRRSLRLPSASG